MQRLLPGVMLAVLLEAAIAVTANAQSPPDAPINTPGSSNLINYPPGTRIYQNGGIQTPNGQVIYPSVAVPRGDGSTTYYYNNGTRIDLNRRTVNPNGTYLAPGTTNGGLSNTTIRLYEPPTFPGMPK